MPLASRRVSGGIAMSAGMRAPEKDFDHLGHADRVGESAFKNLFAGIEHADTVGYLLDEAHEMLDNDDRHIGARKLLQFAADPFEFAWVQAGRELVHEKQPRPGRERAGEIEHLLLRAVQFGGAAI